MRYFDVDTWQVDNTGKELWRIADELSELAARVGLVRTELEKMSGMGEICAMLRQKKVEAGHLAEVMEECGGTCVQIAERYFDTEEDLVFLAKNTALYEQEKALL